MSQEKPQDPKSQNPKSTTSPADKDLETLLFGFELPTIPTLAPVAAQAGQVKVTAKKEMVEKLVAKMKEL